MTCKRLRKPTGSLIARIDKKRKEDFKKEKSISHSNLLDSIPTSNRHAKLIKLCLQNGWALGNLAKPNTETGKVLKALDAWQFAMRKFFHKGYKLRKVFYNRQGREWRQFYKIALACRALAVSPRFYICALFSYSKSKKGVPPFLSFCSSDTALRAVANAGRNRQELRHLTEDFSMQVSKQVWADFKYAKRFYRDNKDAFNSFVDCVSHLFKLGKVSERFSRMYSEAKYGKRSRD